MNVEVRKGILGDVEEGSDGHRFLPLVTTVTSNVDKKEKKKQLEKAQE